MDQAFIQNLAYGRLENFQGKVFGAAIDSRKIEKDMLFFALPGENTDGHKFIPKALKNGAKLCVVSEEWTYSNKVDFPAWIVDSPELALQMLAKAWRETFDIPVIGVTGTNGKTSTRTMISAILFKKYNVHSTTGNLNNHLGVPLTLLQMKKDAEICVLEMGTNHFGEISRLCYIASPTEGLITNIGYGHTEYLVNVEGVAKAKEELFDSLPETGTTYINGDDPYIIKMPVYSRGVWFGFKEQDVDFRGKIKSIDKNGLPTLEINNKFEVKLQFPGKSGAKNALAAITVGVNHSVPKTDIIDALENLAPVSNRMGTQCSCCRIINDTYNANPNSAKSALETLSLMQTNGQRVFVLGDMLELGVHEKELHAEIGKLVFKYGIDLFLAYGKLSRFAAESALKKGHKACFHFMEKKLLIESLKGYISSTDDIVLIKGSRGSRMEDVIEGIVG